MCNTFARADIHMHCIQTTDNEMNYEKDIRI